MENKELLFGTKAIDDRNPQYHLFSAIKRLFGLQSVWFWIIAYIVSLMMVLFLGTRIRLFDFLNVLLFPFTIILMGNLANYFIFSKPSIYNLLYPSHNIAFHVYTSKLQAIMMFMLKLLLFYFAWKYTYIIGIIGLILAIYQGGNSKVGVGK